MKIKPLLAACAAMALSMPATAASLLPATETIASATAAPTDNGKESSAPAARSDAGRNRLREIALWGALILSFGVAGRIMWGSTERNSARIRFY